jgi:hypothetical protein
MRCSRLKALMILGVVAACSDSSQPVSCAPFDPTKEPMSDANLICSVDCASMSADSDVAVHVVPVAPHATAFVATVSQTRPVVVDDVFPATTASWSGHFYNLDDGTSLAPLRFHLLVGRQPGEGNVEIYTDPNTLKGGPVNVDPLDCKLRGY